MGKETKKQYIDRLVKQFGSIHDVIDIINENIEDLSSGKMASSNKHQIKYLCEILIKIEKGV